jgi:hypothetical protein
MVNKWFGSILALAGAAGAALAQSAPTWNAPPSDVTPVAALTPQEPAAGCANGGCVKGSCATPSTGGCTDGGYATPGVIGRLMAPRDGVSDNVFFAGVEYLLWYYKNNHPRVLVGTVPASVIAANPGLNLPPDSIIPLVGGDPGIDYDRQSGVRFSLGVWLDPGQCCGVEAEGFTLERGAFHANFASGGDPVLGPVYNDLSRETIILFADPGLRSGTMNVDANTRFWGAEINVRSRVCSIVSDRCDAFIGFRYLSFDESVNVSGTTSVLPNSGGGFNFSYFDSFGVHNQFYGVQIGLQSDYACGNWFLNLKGKIAIGDMHQTARVDGATTVSPTGPLAAPAFTLPGGVLAQPTNMGRFSQDCFTFVPEITINTGVHLTSNLRAFVGYNFLYVGRLARAAHQTNGVDSSQIPVLNPLNRNVNATQPAFAFNEGRFWAYGLNAGMEFRY